MLKKNAVGGVSVTCVQGLFSSCLDLISPGSACAPRVYPLSGGRGWKGHRPHLLLASQSHALNAFFFKEWSRCNGISRTRKVKHGVPSFNVLLPLEMDILWLPADMIAYIN